MFRENDLICAERAVVATNVGDMLVLLDIDRERYFSLNKVGSLVWSTVQGEATFLAICSKVSEQFDVTYAEAATDIAALLSELKAANLIRVVSGESGHN